MGKTLPKKWIMEPCFPVGMEPIKCGCPLIWTLRAKTFILVMWSTVASKWFFRPLRVSVGVVAVWGARLRKEMGSCESWKEGRLGHCLIRWVEQ